MSYSQAGRRLTVTTPLGENVLLVDGLTGHESISKLFSFRLGCLAENTQKVAFDALLGQKITVAISLPGGGQRHINGVCRRVAQGARDAVFTRYQLEIVPQLWLLSKKTQSRIFQHVSVPDILRKVFAELDVKYELQGVFQPRDYCVQYRESDLSFASRLMEEEGIYYFFKHSAGAHTMVVANTPASHSDLPGKSSLIFEGVKGGTREEDRITEWEKAQELRAGRVTLWDHCFELPHKHLEAEAHVQAAVAAGKSTHKLKVGNNEKLELYDYPGAYAQRFDGIDKSGGVQASELQKIFDDNVRTAEIRMQEEAAASVLVHATSNVRHLVPGYKFTLERHFDGDGPWVVHAVEHTASEAADVRSDRGAFAYENRFSCFPSALPFRPSRVTPKPTIAGTQTAVVVGPPGEEIFCDKYGRVKVQFHWDRDGKKNLDSSCWVRVAQPWAGKRWGAFFWPRIGNEVVVTFEEGDPDRPLIVGSVYNFDNMPPFLLPLRNQVVGIKSASIRGVASQNFNGLIFIDEKGSEHLAIHSERNMTFQSEYDKRFAAGRHKGERVSSASVLTVGNIKPSGGGSGGGPWGKPAPQGVGGLNSIMVYGENLQVAVGLNHQLALGSNIQICINPAGLAAGVPGYTTPPTVSGFLGSGLGGNTQLTIGTSANFVLGRSFDINLGPPKIEVKGGDLQSSHLATYILCGILGALAIVWILFYAGLDEDNERASEALSFQMIFDLLLMCIMLNETSVKAADMNADIAHSRVFNDDDYLQVETSQERYEKMFGGGEHKSLPDYCQTLGILAALFAAFPLPLVAIALEEGTGSFDDK